MATTIAPGNYLTVVRTNGSAQAAIRAGYSKKSAEQIGVENRGKPRIAAAIEDYLRRKSQRSEKTREDCIAEMERLGFANLRDYFSVTSDGAPFIDLSAITRDQAAALVEIEVHDYVDGRGEDARDVKRTRIKMESKRQSLMDGAKLKGFVKDKVELKGDLTIQSRDDKVRELRAVMNLLDDDDLQKVHALHLEMERVAAEAEKILEPARTLYFATQQRFGGRS